MDVTDIFQSFFIIFSSAAVVATLALWGKQPLIVAYILVGMLLGPFGFGFVSDLELLRQISGIGIIFLLFLLGLDMQPSALLSTLRKSTVVVLLSSLVFAGLGAILAFSFSFSTTDALIIGACCMFSSTIIGIKLLPTTALHHRHIGELLVGILLVQDIIAIILISLLQGTDSVDNAFASALYILAMIPLVAGGSLIAVRFILLPLLAKFDRFQEYIFLLSIGWCLGVAEVSELIGLSREIGAFFAGVSLASSPISQYIALSLKPLRDFFLVTFFFALGAGYNFALLEEVWLVSSLLAISILVIKPLTFRTLLRKQSESNRLAWDLGIRLGQISEFSLLVVFVAINAGLLSEAASITVQSAAILTFLVSSYLVIFNLSNPLSPKDSLRRD
ncbi:cation:proton antiporter [Umboniibacter marinipuniceus]|uniref:cation:proton antiporter domain-containing protein n=1 Tax=Umboniibacter marinipuniceus TaxID=569599 RepID=UPI000EF889F3|nr:cation:proton antiporter [Umboniibacter marinipuniceus]